MLSRFSLLISLVALALAAPAVALEGKGFQYKVAGDSLVEWTDRDFPEGLFGGDRLVAGPKDKPPVPAVRGVHFGVWNFEEGGEVRWKDDVEYSAEWKPGDTAHALELVVRGRNKTKKRLDLSRQPLAVWVGPMGSADGGRYALQEVKGFDGADVVALEADKAIEKGMRWVALTDRYRAYVLEKLEGPGSYMVKERAASVKDADGQEANFTAKFLTFRMVEELKGEEEFEVRIRVFAGLKREEILRPAGYLGLYDTWGGWFGWLAYLAFLALSWFKQLSGSWGVAIILLTVAVKALLHPLSKKQYESMEKMKEVQPKIQGIQTRYADNPQRMQAEVAKVWQEAGVNPLSGCLPIFMQMPIFIALYNCLGYAPELRGEPFLWLKDLSAADPLWVLPFLFAFGIFVSSSMSATSNDPSQKMMMQIMPIMMFFFMVGLPSGVMIYLAGQTLLGILEQRSIRGGGPKPPSPTKPAGDVPGPARVIDNEAAKEARKGEGKTGNKYKQNRKGRS